MSNEKFSDNFDVPIDLNLCQRGNIYCKYNEITEENLEYIENAINAYDDNQARIAELEVMLGGCQGEMESLIDEVNEYRASKINAQTETEPDYWDEETLHLIQMRLRND